MIAIRSCLAIRYVEPSAAAAGEPFPWQADFHRSFARFKALSGPIGCGKTQAVCFEALQLAYRNAGRTGLVAAPTYPMLRDATVASFRELLDANEVPYRFEKAHCALRLTHCNSRILFRAADAFDRITGVNLAWFGIDELTSCGPEAWARAKECLRDRNAERPCGFATWTWTPRGFDWVYNLFGPDAEPGYQLVRGYEPGPGARPSAPIPRNGHSLEASCPEPSPEP